jgi:hypothetical protein
MDQHGPTTDNKISLPCLYIQTIWTMKAVLILFKSLTRVDDTSLVLQEWKALV